MELKYSKVQTNYWFTTIEKRIICYVPAARPVIIIIFHEQ